jgi:hypothetical protein
MFGLLVSLSATPGEGLMNFLRRTATANYLTLTDLVDHIRSTCEPELNIFPTPPSPSTWRSAYEHLISNTTNKTWSCLQPKFCTSCLSEHGQFMECWDLTLNTVCTSHKILLENRCLSCGSLFNLQTIESKMCVHCGMSILKSGARSHSVSQEALWLCCEFEKRLMGVSSDGFRSIDQLDTLDLHCIAMCLADLGCNFDNIHAKKRNNLHQLENVYQMTSMAGRLLSDWPVSFHSYLQKLDARVITSRRNSAARFVDRFRVNIYERLASPAFDFVRSELEKHHPPPNCAPGTIKHRPNVPLELTEMMPLKAISKATNINVQLLKRLIAEGELHGYRGFSACGNRTIVADLKQARRLAAALTSRLNVMQTANHLKLPISTIEVLCRNDFFICLGGRPAAGQSWWIDATSFDMSNASIKRQRSVESTISLRDILQHPLMSEDCVAALFRAIQKGVLSVSIIGKTGMGIVGEWRLGNDEWHAWISMRISDTTIVTA